MAKIVLKNPYFEEEIKVKDSYENVIDMLKFLERGNINYLQLQQIERGLNMKKSSATSTKIQNF